jgi:hypothetical protein
MNIREELARQGLRGALEVRRQAGVTKYDPICVYDLAERLDLEVRFCRGNTFGGMYSRSSETILVPTLRPPGRQSSTCAHEIGHWFFGHGTRVDELEEDGACVDNSPDERLANLFANYLLMPPWALDSAFNARNWRAADCTALQAYIVAGQMGVGYETLIQHLCWSSKTILVSHAERLVKVTPKQLRKSVLGYDSSHLIIADKAWTAVSVDLRVGDFAILPRDTRIEGASVAVLGNHELGLLVEARSPGIARAESSHHVWSTFIRVCRKDFEGRSVYRHLEDPDVNQST